MAEKESQPGRYSGRLLTVKEASQALRVSEPTIRRYLHEGLLKGITMPKRGTRTLFRVKGEAIDELLKG